jgi:hypothetical protein
MKLAWLQNQSNKRVKFNFLSFKLELVFEQVSARGLHTEFVGTKYKETL